MLRLIVLLYVLVTSVFGDTTSVVRCTSRDGELPLNVYLEGCITPPCNLPQLQNAVIHIVFRAPHTLRSMRTLAVAFMSIGIITLPVPYDLGPGALTCNFLTNTYCPVMEGEVVQYTLKLFIESLFPVSFQELPTLELASELLTVAVDMWRHELRLPLNRPLMVLKGVAPGIEFSVVDENNLPVFCFRTNIRITPPVDMGNSTLAID